MEEVLLLYRRTADGGRESDPLRLPLRAGKMLITSEVLSSPMPSVYSDAGYEMEIAGFPFPALTVINVSLDGRVIASGVVPLDPVKDASVEGAPVKLRLRREFSAAPFADVFGFAQLEIRFNAQDYSWVLDAFPPPLLVVYPDGPIYENLSRMGSYVCSHYGSFMAIGTRGAAEGEENKGRRLREREADRTRQTDSVRRRLEALRNLLNIFESQFPFFRSNARCKPVDRWESGPVERLREFSARTVNWIVEHPEELTPSAGPRTGIRFGGRNWLPRHTLVRTTARSRNIYEHQVIAGFLKDLEKRVTAEAALFESVLSGVSYGNEASADGRYRSSASAIIKLSARHLEDALHEFEAMKKRIRRACLSYAEALEIRDPKPIWPARATNIFLGIAPYRMLYEAMRAWHREPQLKLAEAEMLFTGFGRSRLYEYFCLFRMIEGIENLGWRFTEAQRCYYQAPGQGVDRAPDANTFLFVPGDGSQDRSIRVFYQPVISAGEHAGENDIGLVRVTNYSLTSETEEAASGRQLQPVANPYYTPDYLIELRVGPRRFWFIADAKYSKLRTVLEEETPSLVWKYLFSIRPSEENGRLEGLWLLCGNESARAEGVPRQRTLSPFVEGAPGLSCGPGFLLEAWDSEGVGQSLLAAIERLSREG